MKIHALKITKFLLLISAFSFLLSINICAQDRGDEHHDRGRHEGWYKHGDRDHHDESYYRENRDDHERHRWDKRDEDYREIRYEDRDYYFHHGEFYERRPEGYIVITAPVGLQVTYLPRGYRVVRHRGIRFYFFGGIYYRFNPRAGLYFVVKSPF